MVIRIFGIIWGLLGVANILMSKAGPNFMVWVVVFNVVLFVIPGMLLIRR